MGKIVKETRCRACGKRTVVFGPLSKAKCTHCGKEILQRHQIKCNVICNTCGFLNSFDSLGWTHEKCKSCNSEIKHPATKHKGGKPDRGVQNDAQISFVLPKENYDEIVKLAKFYKSTKGAVARHLVKIALDRVQ